MTRTVILWTAPRSVSTAVYRSITTLKNTTVKGCLEWFISPYYFAPNPPAALLEWPYQREPDFLFCEPSYSVVCQKILQDYPGVDVLFAKEMAKHLPPKDSEQFPQLLQQLSDPKVTHTFLIRDPTKVIYSQFKLYKKGVAIEKVKGLLELYALYEYLTETLGKNAIVFSTDDILADPDQMMRLYCEAIDIPFEPHMIAWEEGKLDTRMPVKEWESYFDSFQESTGFIKSPSMDEKPIPIHELPTDMVEYIDTCNPRYEKLLDKCNRPCKPTH
ncbi:uncharacterized protein LOC135331342 [Halichondria panicea]|uniref:uncharacterized protein LOC135331342 n=1 Tax=Halichondria panicea TaxID=6063 RepID=UPI00312B3ADE